VGRLGVSEALRLQWCRLKVVLERNDCDDYSGNAVDSASAGLARECSLLMKQVGGHVVLESCAVSRFRRGVVTSSRPH
jgi:hypothetical protein